MARMHPEDLRAIMAAILQSGTHALVQGVQWQFTGSAIGTVEEADALLAELARTAKPEPSACRPSAYPLVAMCMVCGASAPVGEPDEPLIHAGGCPVPSRVPGITPAKKPMPGGFSLEDFMPGLKPEDAAAFADALEGADMSCQPASLTIPPMPEIAASFTGYEDRDGNGIITVNQAALDDLVKWGERGWATALDAAAQGGHR